VFRLSIVIPALGDMLLLEQGLVSVLTHRPDECEVIVVLNGPYADPYDLTDEVTFVRAPNGADWRTSIQHALDRCQAPIVHLLDPGVEVSARWCDFALRHFADQRVGAVTPIIVQAGADPPTAIAGVDYLPLGRRGPRHVPLADVSEGSYEEVIAPTRAAMFLRRDDLEILLPQASEVGDALIDVELGLELRQLGRTVICDYDSVVAVPAPAISRKRPRLRESFLAARNRERLFWRNLPRVGWGRGLVADESELGLSQCSNDRRGSWLGRAVGRCVGIAELGNAVAHWRKMRRLVRHTAAQRASLSTAGPADIPHNYDLASETQGTSRAA